MDVAMEREIAEMSLRDENTRTVASPEDPPIYLLPCVITNEIFSYIDHFSVLNGQRVSKWWMARIDTYMKMKRTLKIDFDVLLLRIIESERGSDTGMVTTETETTDDEDVTIYKPNHNVDPKCLEPLVAHTLDPDCDPKVLDNLTHIPIWFYMAKLHSSALRTIHFTKRPFIHPNKSFVFAYWCWCQEVWLLRHPHTLKIILEGVEIDLATLTRRIIDGHKNDNMTKIFGTIELRDVTVVAGVSHIVVPATRVHVRGVTLKLARVGDEDLTHQLMKHICKVYKKPMAERDQHMLRFWMKRYYTTMLAEIYNNFKREGVLTHQTGSAVENIEEMTERICNGSDYMKWSVFNVCQWKHTQLLTIDGIVNAVGDFEFAERSVWPLE